MDLVTLRRNNTIWNIQQNPMAITIKRTEKTESGGGFEEVKSEVGPFNVRIFNRGSWTPREVSTLAGTKQTDVTWGILTDYLADIRAGSAVLDELECSLGHFQVVGVYPQIINGQIVGYQADLEKVG